MLFRSFRWSRNGETHGTYPVFAVRELFKRLYIMLKFELANGRQGLHMPHVEGAPVYAIESFSDLEVTGEGHYTTLSRLKDMSPARYALAYDTLGHGIPRMGIWFYKSTLPITKNMMLTLHNLHGVTYEYVNLKYSNYPYEAMGGFAPEVTMWKTFNRRDATFLPYWGYPTLSELSSAGRDPAPLNGTIKISAYAHKERGEAILIIANLDSVGYTVKLKPHLEELGLSGSRESFYFTDPILNGYAYPAVGDDILLDIYPQRWRAVLLRKR